MKKGHYLETILRSPKTVFSTKDITLLWRESTSQTTRNRLDYYLKNAQLIRLRRGLYAKDKHYNRLELGSKILTPSYISFETVLAKAGLIFQYDSTVYLASYLTRELSCGDTAYFYRKIKSDILMNPLGIQQKNEYSIATPERAMLDMLYLNKEYYFDNLSGIDWDKAYSIVTIYKNKRLVKTLDALRKNYQEELK